jgi:Fe-S-cluster containining protein
MPGMCASGDVEAIAKYLGQDMPTVLADNFVAGDGAKCMRRDEAGKLEVFSIPTITPRQKPDGACVFLDQAGQCKVHPVSPLGCACVDSHMSRANGGDKIVHDALYEICQDETYQRQWYALDAAGLQARPTKERRADFEWQYAIAKARTEQE